MKIKNLAVAATCATLAFASCNNNSSNVTLKDDYDKTAYAFGYKMGENISQTMSMYGTQLQALDTNVIMAGVRDFINKNSAQIDTAMITKLFNDFQANPTKFSSKTYEEDVKKVKEESAKFLQDKAALPNVQKTASGLLYEVIKEGSGKKPTAADVVSVTYIGKLPDGTVFDQSPNGQPISFPLSGVIKGWTEGLQLMTVGSKYKFYIPNELAYGESAPQGSPIKAGHALEFEVELIKIGQ